MRVDDRPGNVGEVEFLLQHVGRDGDQHRSHGGLQSHLEGAPDHQGEVFRVYELRAPLGMGPAHAQDIAAQVRVALQETGVVLTNGDHQRDGSRLGVVQHRSGRGQAGTGMQVEEPGPARRPRISLGHAGADGLLEPQHVPDLGSFLEGVHEVDLRRPRDAEHVLHAFTAE